MPCFAVFAFCRLIQPCCRKWCRQRDCQCCDFLSAILLLHDVQSQRTTYEPIIARRCQTDATSCDLRYQERKFRIIISSNGSQYRVDNCSHLLQIELMQCGLHRSQFEIRLCEAILHCSEKWLAEGYQSV